MSGFVNGGCAKGVNFRAKAVHRGDVVRLQQCLLVTGVIVPRTRSWLLQHWTPTLGIMHSTFYVSST